MKTGILASPTIAAEEMTGSVMGMSAKGTDIAAYFLRDKIYTDKALAVIREYICNAVDEHRKYKVDKPVLVKLEYNDETHTWVWTVRDYAKGLSDHGVRNIFGMYFESTKGHDNSSIGGFGIGSKAGLCFVDTFYITSYFEGTKMSYVSSLGAGNKGVPVGEIYDISSEPTDESGIEIKIEVPSSEINTFFRTCVRFVEGFSNDVGLEFHTSYTNVNSHIAYTTPTAVTVYTPIVPLDSAEIMDGYVLNRYDRTPAFNPNYLAEGSVGIRMGGVIYTHKVLGANQYAGLFEGYQILDVPIGALSIPISRENIETTPANDRVYADIIKAYSEFMEEDRLSLVTPKMGDLIDRHHNNSFGHSNRIQGKWFHFLGRKAYPEPYEFIQYIRRSAYLPVARNQNKKHVVYMLPDIKNQQNWMERLRVQLAQLPNYTAHYLITKTEAIQNTIDDPNSGIDFSDVQFVDIKSLKLPPLPKNPTDGKTKYLVYKSGYKSGSYTPDELELYVSDKKGVVVDLDDDWWLTTTSIANLNLRTIGLVNKHGTHNQYFSANSKKLVDLMLGLGWLSPDSQEYLDSVKRITEEENEKARIGSVEPSLKAYYFDTTFHPNIIKAIIRDDSKMDRLKQVRNRILAEDSTRGRILRKLTRLSSYDGTRHIPREDLRRIMTLK